MGNLSDQIVALEFLFWQCLAKGLLQFKQEFGQGSN